MVSPRADPTGQRYCINSAALKLEEKLTTVRLSRDVWGVEAAFRRLDGVVATAVGYAGGVTDNLRAGLQRRDRPREVVEVTFDPERVAYEQLLAGEHDPTQLNRQGPTLWISVIFVHDEAAPRRRSGARAVADLTAGRDADRRGADLLAGRGLPPAVPREARPRDLPRGTCRLYPPPVGSDRSGRFSMPVRRRGALLAMAVVVLVDPTASPSQLLDDSSSGVQLAVHAKGEALVT